MAGILDVVRILNNSEKAKKVAAAEKATEMVKAAERAAKLKSIRQIEVEGKLYEFPADATNEEIQTVLNKKLGPTPMQQRVQKLEQENAQLKAAPPATRTTADLKNSFVDDTTGEVISPIQRTVSPKGLESGVDPDDLVDRKLNLYKWRIEKNLIDNGPTNYGTYKLNTKQGEITNTVQGMKIDVGAFLLMGKKDVQTLAVHGTIPQQFADFYLEWINKMSTNAFSKRMSNVKFILGTDNYTSSGAFDGWHNSTNNMIFANQRVLYSSPKEFYQVGLHEIGHAATVWSYDNISNVKRTWDNLYQEWLLNTTNVLDRQQYMWADTKELIAEGMSNPAAKRVLSQIEYTGKHQAPNGVTAWDAFVHNVARFLGLGSLAVGTAEFEFAEQMIAPPKAGTDGA